MKKQNYYVNQFDKALKNHDVNYNLTLKVYGTEGQSNNLKMPFELALLIKDWYYLNVDKI